VVSIFKKGGVITLEFFVQNPVFIYLIPLWSILSLLFWKKSSIIISRAGRFVLPIIHILIVILLSLSLAELKLVFRSTRELKYKVVFIVDASASVSKADLKSKFPSIVALANSAEKIEGMSAEILLFNSKVSPLPGGGNGTLSQLESLVDSVKAFEGGSDISEALNSALGAIPGDSAGSIILLSDGVNTGSSLTQKINIAAERKIPLMILPLSGSTGDSLRVDQLKLPSKVYVHERYPVEVLIYSKIAGSVELGLYRDEKKITYETVSLNHGMTRWLYSAIEDNAGQHRYKVEIKPIQALDDLYVENNTQIGAVLAETLPSLLLVTADPSKISAFINALDHSGLKTKVISPSAFPFSLSSLLQYSAIIFENVPQRDLTLRQLKYVKSYVKDYGGGFLMTGGRDSFGPGGYSDSDIEDITPVLMSPQTYSSSFGLILLLDSSGSMKGYPIDWVKRAAKQIVWLMRGRYLGIYHFNHQAHIAVPLQQVERNRLTVDQDIDSIVAEGATAFSEALSLAARHLDERGFSSKHIILLSDGNPSDVMLLEPLYPLLLRAGVKVSTIGIGHQVNNSILKEIADRCGGKFYHSAEFDRIPKIFEEEIIRVIGPPYVEEEFIPQLKVMDGTLHDLSTEQFQKLGGYIGTTLKKGAIGELFSHKNDVIYAHWQCGLGKSAVFTSTAGYGDWSGRWPQWKSLAPFWGGVVKSILRTRTSNYEINIKTTGSNSDIFIDAVDSSGKYINGDKLTLWVVNPLASKAAPVPVKQIALGQYHVAFNMEHQGFYNLSLSRETETGRREEVATTVIAMPFSPEYSFQKSSSSSMNDLVKSTGGFILSSLDKFDLKQDFKNRLVKDVSFYELWEWLLLAAFLFYVVEISLRRLNVFARDDRTTGSGETVQFKRIADNFMKMARELDLKGDEVQAQKFYLKARSFYLKAEHTDNAARMWERFKHLDSKRNG
jgi:uncharacterized protein with von Willebrand factor type A (vWA) domain